MNNFITKKIKLRNPFKLLSLPKIFRLYQWAMQHKFSSLVEQKVLAPSICLLYLIIQRLYLFKFEGTFSISGSKKENLKFNAKNTQFDSINDSVFSNGYEPEVTALLDILLSKTDNFYDIGSNWGFFSFYAATQPEYKGVIHAFEPFPSSYSDLKDIVIQTNLNDKIICHELALSDHNGEAEMRFSGLLHSGFAYISPSQDGISLNPHAKVVISTLDSLKLETPQIIKIDAQFHEGEIINGAKRTLSQNTPYIIMESCLDFNHPEMTMQPLKLLADLGYVFYFPTFINEKSGKIVIPSEADKNNFASSLFSIIPINIDERFLYRDTINLLACHKSKVKNLTSLFK